MVNSLIVPLATTWLGKGATTLFIWLILVIFFRLRLIIWELDASYIVHSYFKEVIKLNRCQKVLSSISCDKPTLNYMINAINTWVMITIIMINKINKSGMRVLQFNNFYLSFFFSGFKRGWGIPDNSWVSIFSHPVTECNNDEYNC